MLRAARKNRVAEQSVDAANKLTNGDFWSGLVYRWTVDAEALNATTAKYY